MPDDPISNRGGGKDFTRRTKVKELTPCQLDRVALFKDDNAKANLARHRDAQSFALWKERHGNDVIRFAKMLTYGQDNPSLDIAFSCSFKKDGAEQPYWRPLRLQKIPGEHGQELDDILAKLWHGMNGGNHGNVKHVYVHANSIKARKELRPHYTSLCVDSIRAVFVDIDPVNYDPDCEAYFATLDDNGRSTANSAIRKAEYIRLWEQERDRLRECARTHWALPTKPSMIVDTGGGYQLWWLLSEPVPATEANRSAFAQIEANLIAATPGADSKVRDLPRLLRLPGTFNGKATRPSGMAQIATKILPEEAHRYSLHDLMAGWPTVEIETPTDDRVGPLGADVQAVLARMSDDPTRSGLLDRLPNMGGYIGDLWRDGPDARGYIGDDTSGSQLRWNLAFRMAEACLGPADFSAVVVEWPHAYGANPFDAWSLARTWAHAEAALAKQNRSKGDHFSPENEEGDCAATERPANDNQGAKGALRRRATMVRRIEIGNLFDMLSATLDVLGEIDPAQDINIVKRGGRLHRAPTPEAPHLTPLTRDDMAAALAARVVYYVVTKDGEKEIPPPRDLMGALCGRAWPEAARTIAECHGVIAGPRITASGDVVNRVGLDRASGLWILGEHPGLDIPDRPTRADALAAAHTLEALLDGVPFAGDAAERGAYRAAALALLNTGVVRPEFAEAPACMISAPLNGSGSGKTYLAKVAAVLATGKMPAVRSPGADEEELRKVINAALGAGQQIIVLDNINRGGFNSDVIANVITSESYSFRVLGKSDEIEVSTRTLLIMTGNGLSPSQDLTRRFLTVRLDRARAGDRSEHNGPLARVLADRPRYLAAVATILRWGHHARAAGEIPNTGMEGFGRWHEAIVNPLVALGYPDPLAVQTLARDADPIEAERSDLFGRLRAVFGAREFTTRTLYQILAADGAADFLDDDPDLKDADPKVLADLADALRAAMPNNRGPISPQALGRRFTALADVSAGGWTLTMRRPRANCGRDRATYRVLPTSEAIAA